MRQPTLKRSVRGCGPAWQQSSTRRRDGSIQSIGLESEINGQGLQTLSPACDGGRPRGKPMAAHGSPRQSQNTGGDEDRSGGEKSDCVSRENLIG